MTEIYAEITGWAFVLLREPDRKKPTTHLVGYIIRHARLDDYAGEPYIGSSLAHIDLERRLVRNRRGKIIALVGDPLPLGPLPNDLYAIMRRAEWEWNLEDGATWERVEAAPPAVLR